MLLTLLALLASPPDVAAQGADSFPSLPEALRAGEGRVQPCLGQLPGEVLCGRYRVLENRAAGSGRTVDVAFVLLKALDGIPRADVVVPLNGGPGAPTTPFAEGMASFLAYVRAERDILLVDHRGTGRSQALTCEAPFPGGVASRMTTLFPLDHLVACRDRLAERADLAQYTTANAMDDLEDLTAWLGYEQVDLNGGSYGTREALVFTRRHPDRVRALILDGVAPVEQKTYLRAARSLDLALEGLSAECGTQPECLRAFPDLAQAFRDVFGTARSGAPPVEIEGDTVRMGPGPLAYALRGLLYARAGAVPAMVMEARSGSWRSLARAYLDRQAWVGSDDVPAGYHLSVLCAEDLRGTTSGDVARATEGTYLGDFLVTSYLRACEAWPSARLPEAYFAPVASDRPALLLSGGRDPVTPPANADEVARLWPNSRHVVVPNGGHGQSGPCVEAMVLEVIRTASANGIDRSCLREAPPTRFTLPGGSDESASMRRPPRRAEAAAPAPATSPPSRERRPPEPVRGRPTRPAGLP